MAVNAGCTVIEADIWFHCGEILMSHIWKPFSFMYRGTLESYMKKVYERAEKDKISLYVEIDVKDFLLTGKMRKKFIQRAEQIFEKYAPLNGNVTALFFGRQKQKRNIIAQEMYENCVKKCKARMNNEFENDLKNQKITLVTCDYFKKTVTCDPLKIPE
jgi:hypothetical protein